MHLIKKYYFPILGCYHLFGILNQIWDVFIKLSVKRKSPKLFQRWVEYELNFLKA